MRADRDRLARYMAAAEPWRARWIELEREVGRAPLKVQHARLVEAALGVLPFEVEATAP
jgi:hypothetical protein